ncbi:MAG TPA: hypothetical protein VIM16_06140 [Mucilaginibacter sp.]|jgi:hypothetical protein
MDTYNDPSDWYEWLVAQSRTNHIYDLIHGYLAHDFCPAGTYDFVLLSRDDLPQIIHTVSGAYYNVSRRDAKIINSIKYVVISNNHLTEYLEAAWQMEAVEDEAGNSYIRLIFTRPDNETEDEDDEPVANMADHEDDVLKQCWDLVVAGTDRQLALTYALVGEAFLKTRQQELATGGGAAGEVIRISIGFHIVSAAYAWNDRFTEAAKCDEQYILKPFLWSHMEKVIKPYLEMLMIKKQTEYLDYLFSHTAFRTHFYVHYETHMSIKDPNFEWTRMREIVPILNRVDKGNNYL